MISFCIGRLYNLGDYDLGYNCTEGWLPSAFLATGLGTLVATYWDRLLISTYIIFIANACVCSWKPYGRVQESSEDD